MLDEVGNLQSDGHGIESLETLLSIGLGQEQFFTLILQTLTQLTAVYGDSSDKTIQGNAADIIFLKSSDDTLIERLVKMSGEKHIVASKNSRTITTNEEKLVMKNDAVISYTDNVEKVPTLNYNNFNNIYERNSIVFRAGDFPIWNKNQLILPMSWKLFSKPMGRDYTLQDIPTFSQAIKFDADNNMPDFVKMVQRRVEQAMKVEKATNKLREAYGWSDDDFARRDINTFSDDVMNLVNENISPSIEDLFESVTSMKTVENEEYIEECKKAEDEKAWEKDKCYLDGEFSYEDLRQLVEQDNFNETFANTIRKCRNDLDGSIFVYEEKTGDILYQGKILYKCNTYADETDEEKSSNVYQLVDSGDKVLLDIFKRINDWNTFAPKFVETFKRAINED